MMKRKRQTRIPEKIKRKKRTRITDKDEERMLGIAIQVWIKRKGLTPPQCDPVTDELLFSEKVLEAFFQELSDGKTSIESLLDEYARNYVSQETFLERHKEQYPAAYAAFQDPKKREEMERDANRWMRERGRVPIVV